MNKRLMTCAGRLALLMLATLSMETVHAAADSAGQEAMRQQERERELRRQQEKTPNVRLRRDAQAGDAKRIFADESPCFPISRIVLHGARADYFNDALRTVTAGPDAAIGRCLGTAGINTVLMRVQNAIVADGFVTTRILAGPQDLHTGELILTVLPGRVHAVRFAAAADPRGNQWNAMPMRNGDLLNLRDIEQGLENFKRVPTAEAEIQIEPAAVDADQADNAARPEALQEGQSDLVIQYRQATPFRLNLSLDDGGSSATGKYQGGATVSYDNWWTLNDLFYFSLNSDLGGGSPSAYGTRSYIAHYSAPFGYWALGVTASANRYYQTVAGASQAYVYSGRSESKELKLSRVLYRDAVRKTSMSLRGMLRSSNNFIDDTEIEVQRRRTAAWEIALAHREFIGDASLDTALAYRRGTGAFDAMRAPEERFDEGTSRFRIVTADINLGVGSASLSVDESHKSAGSSGWFATKTVETRDKVARTQAQGSTFSGHTVSLQAGNDINVTGSDVVSTADTTLVANHDINIAAAVDMIDETHLRDEETSGLFTGGGMGFTIGAKAKNSSDRRTGFSAAASSIGSTEGSIGISAGNSYRQTGSQLLTPKGNIDIAAKRVDIVAAGDTERNTRKTVSTQSGLSMSITNPIIAAVQSVRQMKAASKKTKDRRMQGLASAAAALSLSNAQDAVAASAAPAGGIDLAVSIGGSKSINRSEKNSVSAHGSRIAAGGNITIVASGAGKDSDLTIQGSDIAAGKDIILRADDEINLLAAQNTDEQHSSNKGGSASIGFSVGTSGYMINAGASGNIGRGDGGDLIHANTHVDAARNLIMDSGADTNIIGAVASGKQVTVDVGTAGAGNLNILSLQDSSDYKSSQQSLGGNISVGIGKMSGSVSASQSKVDGKYRSVNEQSGIAAGDGGFDIEVHGNTHLAGGKIASTDKAAKNGKGKNKNKNSFTTETLTQSDIDNYSEHKASSLSLNIGGGYGAAGSAMNGTGIGNGNSSGSDSNVTKSGISNAALDITDGNGQIAKTGRTAKETIADINSDVSTDRDTSGKLTKGWDGEQLQEEVTAQAEITAAFGKESSKGIGTYATNKENDLRRQAKAAEKNDPALARKLNAEAEMWGEGGAYRSAMHAAAGKLVGGWDGAAGAMASTQVMPQLSAMIEKLDLPNAVKQGLAQVAAGAVGAMVGGVRDMIGALNVEANNRQLHRSETEMIKKNAMRFAKEMYGTDDPAVEQLMGATAILSNTAQHLLDNNLGYTVPYSKQAAAFLQTLQSEYAAISPNLSIGDGQYLFYATQDQKSDSSLNIGHFDKGIADLISKTPIKTIDVPVAIDHRRDARTGLPLDDQGRYSEQAYVNGDIYQPKYFPCAALQCQDHNLDMSDAGTQAYVKAMDLDILEKIGQVTDLAIVASPIGGVGIASSLAGSAAGLTAGVIDDSLGEAVGTEVLEYGAEMYLQKVYRLPKAAAARAVALIDLAGGWDAFVERTGNYLPDDGVKVSKNY